MFILRMFMGLLKGFLVVGVLALAAVAILSYFTSSGGV
jgi:hypothetical protein